MTPNERHDAISLLRTIYEGHETTALDHGWRKCRRCATLYRLDLHDKLLMHLVRLTLEELEKEPTT